MIVKNDRDIVLRACDEAGLGGQPIQLLRLGENSVWRVGQEVVARVSRAGQQQAAAREIVVASWLATDDFPSVRPAAMSAQPWVVDGRAVTFWEALDVRRAGTPVELARLLRRLHDMPLPTGFTLASLDPFVRLPERIVASEVISENDQQWLLDRVSLLRDAWHTRPSGLAECVVHGDAWVGNVAVGSDDRPVLLDLERAGIGPPEWDLVSTAIRLGSFAWITRSEYRSFADEYGHEVTGWEGFALMRDIRELRMASYLLQRAKADPTLASNARHRVECIRGRHGPRPWQWRTAG